MTEFQNTLFVTKENSYLYKDHENCVLKFEDNTEKNIPFHHLASIIIFGNSSLSPPLMHACLEKNIHISFISMFGKFQGRLEGSTNGSVLLRKAQFLENKTRDLKLCKNIVFAKIHNSNHILKRHLRDYNDSSDNKIKEAVISIQYILNNVTKAEDIDSLRGYEGSAANLYFSVFQNLIRNSDFTYKERSRRPAKDPINALLNLGYSLLMSECCSALQSVGLDPAAGYLHTLRPGRMSLALDLMEEFRAPIVDRLVLSFVNKKQCSLKDFNYLPNLACEMTEELRKLFLTEWHKRKSEEIIHPFSNSTINWGTVPYFQAKLLARCIRDPEINEYPAFLLSK